MYLFLGLVALEISVIAAAPRIALTHRDQSSPASRANDYVPLRLRTGAEGGQLESVTPATNEIEERTVKKTSAGKAKPKPKHKAQHKPKAAPKPKSKPKAKPEKKIQQDLPTSPPDGFVPPPLTLVNGGVRPYVPIERPVGKRDIMEPTPASTMVHTVIFPSPRAQGVSITEQHQIVTSFVPMATCSLQSSSNEDEDEAPSPSCTTTLVPTETPICATTLFPLAAEPVVISNCDQYFTYSTQIGYELAPLTTGTAELHPKHDIQIFTTYRAAPWVDVIPGMVPTTGIEVVCASGSKCVTGTFPERTTSPQKALIDFVLGRDGDAISAEPGATQDPVTPALPDAGKAELRA